MVRTTTQTMGAVPGQSSEQTTGAADDDAEDVDEEETAAEEAEAEATVSVSQPLPTQEQRQSQTKKQHGSLLRNVLIMPCSLWC